MTTLIKRISWPCAVIAVLLVVTVTLAAISTKDALVERDSVVAATDLRVAAVTVASADALAGHGENVPAADLAPYVATLRGTHELALRSLSAPDAARAEALLKEIAECGSMLLSTDGTMHELHNHAALLKLIDVAADTAGTSAAAAERKAIFAILGALLVALIGAAVLIRARHRKERERAHAAAQARAGQRLQSLLNDSPEIFLVIDQTDTITYRSKSADRLLGTATKTAADLVARATEPERDALRRHLAGAALSDASATFTLHGVSGHPESFQVRVSDLTNDELVGGRVVTIRDVTAEVQLRGELERQANTDFLTGLPNRRVLDATIEAAKAISRHRGSMIALLTIDIDGFKTINDTLGHLAGDRTLRQVSERLSHALSSRETLLRLGGDEFAVVLPDVPNTAAAMRRANELLSLFETPLMLGERHEQVRASFGVAVTATADHAGSLLAEADVAMYKAKRDAGNTVVLYDPTLDAEATRATRITRALRDMDYDREFTMVYQPIVRVDSDEIVCLESLLRWTSPELGVVGPDEFIPIAEEAGEICRIGRWVVNQVCRQMAEWNALGLDPGVSVSVNVSPRQLAEDAFVPGILATAERWSIAPRHLVIEVTESATLDPTGGAAARLDQLRQAGLMVSIDDFGSGYSNLGQLLHVPLDVIKIDRSLLLTLSDMRMQAGGDPTGPCSIMEAIVAIARTLRAPVVCEGVETEIQRTSLANSGVDYVQGYLIGRPMPADVVTAHLCDPARETVRA